MEIDEGRILPHKGGSSKNVLVFLSPWCEGKDHKMKIRCEIYMECTYVGGLSPWTAEYAFLMKSGVFMSNKPDLQVSPLVRVANTPWKFLEYDLHSGKY